jgi:ATPase family associated with various cellular activities (AAA)
MENLNTQKIVNMGDLFDDHFLDPKSLYIYSFNRLPSLSYIGNIDGEKAFGAFKEKFDGKITGVYRYDWYEVRKKQYQFDTTMVLLDNFCLIEFYKSYCEIWHDGERQEFISEVTGLLSPIRERQRRKPLELNLVVQGRNKLELKAKEVKRTRLDLGLFYGEDFKETDELIRKRLNKKNDKGIVLLHGLPGAGKTTYLRYLMGKIKKRVLFLSPSLAGNLMNPDFIELLTNNPNTVLIIEDAENIIMDRKINHGSAVSNLLNISDGLLADFLNVQLICTFNNSLTLIDSALLRKGRLIAKYEFGKLTVSQSQRLSDHLGFDTKINRPMTVAEIANQHEKQAESGMMEVIGFRRS